MYDDGWMSRYDIMWYDMCIIDGLCVGRYDMSTNMDGYEHTSMVFLWGEFQSWEDLCTNFECTMWTWRARKQTKANSMPRFKVARKSRNLSGTSHFA